MNQPAMTLLLSTAPAGCGLLLGTQIGKGVDGMVDPTYVIAVGTLAFVGLAAARYSVRQLFEEPAGGA